VPRSSEIATKLWPAGGVQRCQLGEDQLLGCGIDHQRLVTALAATELDRALTRARMAVEHRAQLDDDPPARREPVWRRRGGLHADIS
jgi:hypothetical protein